MATDILTAPTIMGTASRPKIYKNFIDGEWVEASTGETFENRNPADTRDVVGFFQKSAKADVDAAVEADLLGFLDDLLGGAVPFALGDERGELRILRGGRGGERMVR